MCIRDRSTLGTSGGGAGGLTGGAGFILGGAGGGLGDPMHILFVLL